MGSPDLHGSVLALEAMTGKTIWSSWDQLLKPWAKYQFSQTTVDGQNPAPPGMYETL